MPKENSNHEAANSEAATPEVVAKAQYDAVVKQVQELATEANRRLSILEGDKKTLTAALNTINKLVDKLLTPEDK